jgi:ABC-type multidrug transport system permease subunit
VRVSAKAVQDAVQAAAAVMIIFIMLGVIYFVVRQLEAHGLLWPLDTALSVLVGFVELIMTLDDIVGLVVLIAIFIIILWPWLRLGGSSAGR